MKKLVFVSIVGSAAFPCAAFAQDPVAEEADPPAESGVEEAAAEEEEEGSWTDGLKFNIFADTFYQQDWNNPDNPADTGAPGHRDYNYTDGFGLAFAGVDASYTGEHWGATVGLRFGPGAERYLIGAQLRPGAAPASVGGFTPSLAAVKQAYGSIIPTDSLTIDVGLWDTPYGAEVADSWVNLNYTRTPLNFVMQPFYHLGVRATYQLNDNMVIKGLIANPTNAYTAFNDIPYVGAQFGYTSDSFALYAGYMGGEFSPGDEASHTWENFVDVIGVVTAGDLTATVNFDLWHMNLAGPNATAWGVSGAVGYRISPMFGVAARFDYLENSDGYFTKTIYSWDQMIVATGTLDIRPWEDNVIIRLEHRFEQTFGTMAERDIYVDDDGGLTDTWMSTIASVVVRTGN